MSYFLTPDLNQQTVIIKRGQVIWNQIFSTLQMLTLTWFIDLFAVRGDFVGMAVEGGIHCEASGAVPRLTDTCRKPTDTRNK